MTTFFAWMAVTTSALFFYCLILWRRSKKNYRFQARLSIIFLLLVLIPTIPLTLFISSLLTQSSEVLLLPGIENALNRSLETIRNQLEHHGSQYLNTLDNLENVSPQMLRAAGINYLAEYQMVAGKVSIRSSVAQSRLQNFDLPQFTESEFTAIMQNEIKNKLHKIGDHYVFETFKVTPSGTLLMACYQVEDHVSQAIHEISFTLRNYTSLSFLRDTLIEQGVIWAGGVIFILVLTLISVLVARRLAKEISGPIHTLTENMQRVAAGNLDLQVNVTAKDEIAFLVTSFNKMITDLKQSREKLIQTERIAAWRDVARQISHEIKNPLTPIQINLYQLRKNLAPEQLKDSKIADFLAAIEEELQSMRRLADEFSEFARMPEVVLKPTDLNAIIHTSITLFEAESRKVTFQLSLDETLPLLLLDRDQIRRAINNLIKNAMDASELGDRIEIISQRQPEANKIQLLIKDHGKGMSPEVLAKATQPYFTTKKYGTGLGLFLVEKILTDHGASLTITSQEDKGTTVTIIFSPS